MYSRPTLKGIIARIIADIELALGQTVPSFAKSILRVLAKAYAGAVFGVYGFIAWGINQIFPDTAESEFLDRQAGIWGLTRKAAGYAAGAVTITGTNGKTVGSGIRFISPAGVEYESTTGGTITGAGLSVDVVALAAGTAGNMAAGDSMALVYPVSGVDAVATVGAQGVYGGVDEESDDDLRDRILARIQNPPQGGSVTDYENWALERSGITRAYGTENWNGVGTVLVTCVADGNPDKAPTAAQILDVQTYIETVRPVGAKVTIGVPVIRYVNFTISVIPNSEVVKAAIATALTNHLEEVGIPKATINRSNLDEVISGAEGESSHTMTQPAADITLGNLEFAALGTITWGA